MVATLTCLTVVTATAVLYNPWVGSVSLTGDKPLLSLLLLLFLMMVCLAWPLITPPPVSDDGVSGMATLITSPPVMVCLAWPL